MKTVEKTINILEVFLKHQGEIGIVELASLIGSNVSTTHRIASTLVKRGYLEQKQRRRGYSLSPRLLQFSNIILKNLEIRNVALPFLHELNKITDESANLAILGSEGVIFVESIESSRPLRLFVQLGSIEPAHCCAAGKVFLAYIRDRELERFLSRRGLPRYTENTICDVTKLKEELSIIKREGTAVDNEEFMLGAKCVGAPVKDVNGNIVAAVTVSGPSARLSNGRVQELKSLVKSCALEISRAIGYRNEEFFWQVDCKKGNIRREEFD